MNSASRCCCAREVLGSMERLRAGLALVALAEPWAERRFVVCHRAEPRLSDSARRLLAQLQLWM